jgi:CTP:molybdopterin cytidylyltransferase MocA
VTVAAVILAANEESALADADGQPRVRRLVDAAWAGGAVPAVVVAPDSAGRVANALAGAPATLAEPAPNDRGPVAQIARGIEIALSQVRETDAALVWPARLCWVDPETVTSLIEAHGVRPGVLLRPAYEGKAGWPIILPTSVLDRLRTIGADRMPDDVVDDLLATGLPSEVLDLGDPGVTQDGSIPRDQLPPYLGPFEPAGGHVHEWGAAVADHPDDVPLEGPALAPYGQAVAGDPDQPG